MGGDDSQLTPAEMAARLAALLEPGDDIPAITARLEQMFAAVLEAHNEGYPPLQRVNTEAS